MKGEYALPFYGDFPAMPDVERRATWKLMLGEESTTKIIMDTLNQAGYDESRDLLQSYKYIEGGFSAAMARPWLRRRDISGLGPENYSGWALCRRDPDVFSGRP